MLDFFILFSKLLHSIRFGHCAKISFCSRLNAISIHVLLPESKRLFLGNLSDKLFSGKTNDFNDGTKRFNTVP